jgi:hypothetical protein
MNRILNNTRCHLLDLSARFLDEVLGFRYCGAQIPAFGHFGHLQAQAHVSLFLLYTTTMPFYRSRHVKYLDNISCCIKN